MCILLQASYQLSAQESAVDILVEWSRFELDALIRLSDIQDFDMLDFGRY